MFAVTNKLLFLFVPHVDMNGRQFPVNRDTLLIKAGRTRGACGFVFFAIDCRPQCIQLAIACEDMTIVLLRETNEITRRDASGV